MKRIVIFLIFIIMLSGCNAAVAPNTPPGTATAAPGNSPMPTATPAPPPPSVLCIMDSLEEDAPEFFQNITGAATAYDWELTTVEAPGGFDSVVGKGVYDGIIALRTQQKTGLGALATAAKNGVAVTVADMYADRLDSIPSGLSYAGYQFEGLEELVLQTALAYPPHDTPVRLLALLLHKDSPADIAYQQAITEGKVFDRATHYADSGQTAKAFLEKQLDRWIEGMLDAIYVEDMGTAMQVLEALKAHGREDAEVFAVPNRNMHEQRKLYRRYVFPVAFGADLATEATMQVASLARLLDGGQPERRVFTLVVENMEP